MHHQCVDFVSFERLPLVFEIKSWVRHRDRISLNVCVWHVVVLRLFVAQQYLLWNNHSSSTGTTSPTISNCVVYLLLQFHYVSFPCVLNFNCHFPHYVIHRLRAPRLLGLSQIHGIRNTFRKASNIRCVRACISMTNKCDVSVPYPSNSLLFANSSFWSIFVVMHFCCLVMIDRSSFVVWAVTHFILNLCCVPLFLWFLKCLPCESTTHSHRCDRELMWWMSPFFNDCTTARLSMRITTWAL